jgi:hypothetical protein
MVCLVLLLVAILHIYWAFGGHKGINGAIPTVKGHRLLHPGHLGTFIVALLIIVAGVVVGIQGRIIPIPFFKRIGFWGSCLIATVFLIRSIGDFKYVGLFKTVNYSVFAQRDTEFYTPLCLLLTVMIVFVTIVGGNKAV